jgi:hypothetical protein
MMEKDPCLLLTSNKKFYLKEESPFVNGEGIMHV